MGRFTKKHNMENKKKSNIQVLIAVPFLVMVLIGHLPQLYVAYLLPFKSYNLFKGLTNSEFVGLDNFKRLLDNPVFPRALMNTIILGMGVSFLLAITAFILGIGLSYIKSRSVRIIFYGLFILPFIIPEVYWVNLVMKIFGPNGAFAGGQSNPLILNGAFLRIIYICIESFRLSGLGAIWVSFAIRSGAQKSRWGNGMKAAVITLFLGLAFGTYTNFGLIRGLANPITYEQMDTLTYLVFREGFMNGQFVLSPIIWILQSMWIFIVLLITGLIYKLMFNKREEAFTDSSSSGSSILGILIAGVHAINIGIVLLLLVGAYISTIQGGDLRMLYGTKIQYGLLALVSTSISIGLAVVLAYPMTSSNKVIRYIYGLILIGLISIQYFGIHDFITIKNMGLFNTYGVILLADIFNPIYVVLIGIYYNMRVKNRGVSFIAYIKRIIPILIFLAFISFMLNSDSNMVGLICMRDIGKMPGSVIFERIMSGY